MSEQSIPLTIPSGVNKSKTSEDAIGRWTDAENIVFEDGRPRKRSGNVAHNTTTSFEGRARGMRAWNKVQGQPLYALGTNLKIYGSTDGVELIDITPYRFLNSVDNVLASTANSGIIQLDLSGPSTGDYVYLYGNSWNGGNLVGGAYLGTKYEVIGSITTRPSKTLTDPFTMESGSAVVTVADTNHKYLNGATVNFSGASAAHGLTISGDYTIANVTTDRYEITASGSATSTGSGGGTVTRQFKSINDLLIINADEEKELTNPFTTNGTTTCTVADAAHSKATGDIVYYSGATAVGGQTPSGEYSITKVDDDSYTITLSGSASAATGGGTPTRYFLDKPTSQDERAQEDVNYVLELTNILTTTAASKEVSVNITGHGALYNDGVWISGATAVGGITVDGFYRVTEVTDADNFKIEHSAEATSGASGGGANILVLFEIPTGPADKILEQRGFGQGSMGFGAFGSTSLELDPVYYDPRTVAIDTVGEDAFVCPLGGSLYYWDSSKGNRAELIPNAPTQNRYAFQTEERHLHVLGAGGDPLKMAWASQNEVNTWTATDLNTANESRKVNSGSALIAGCAVADGVNLIWTDTTCYIHQYVGGRFIYRTRIIGRNAGLIGPNAWCNTPLGPMWMSRTQFHLWNGSVQPVPRSEDMESWIFKQLDPNQWSKSWLIYNPITNSVYAYYVPVQSGEPSKYVIINLDDWSWCPGTETRTIGAYFDQGYQNPLQTGTDGTVYRHEEGVNDNGTAANTYITYATIDIADGAVNHEIFGIDPDFKTQVGDVSFQVSTYDRNPTNVEETETVTLATGTELEDLRVHGRRHTGTFSQNLLDGDFEIGVPKILIQLDGARR